MMLQSTLLRPALVTFGYTGYTGYTLIRGHFHYSGTTKKQKTKKERTTFGSVLYAGSLKTISMYPLNTKSYKAAAYFDYLQPMKTHWWK